MNLLVPTALAFSAIIPIILLLYFMRPKRQERVVGSTLLWRQALQDLQASRPWQRLHVTPLLLLQLLAAIVIVLILARPAIFSSSPISGNTIIILQASASMQATDVAPTRFENAKNTITDMIDSMGTGDHISLITMTRTPQALITDSQDKGQLLNALHHAQVTNEDADLSQALSLADSLATAQSNPQVLVIGDGHILPIDQPLLEPFPVRYMPVGTDAPNVALLTLASRTLQGKLIALAQVANYSHQERAIPVELYADGKLVSVQKITLAAGNSGTIAWGPLPSSAYALHAHIISQDAMSVDHDAWAIVGNSIHGKALLVTKGNTFLATALALQPSIKLYTTTPDKYAPATNYDLTIFDGYAPTTLPTGNVLFFNPPPGNYLFGTVGQASAVSNIHAGNDTINMLTNVDLSTIHALHSSHQLTLASWMQPIIAATETPLLIAGENNNRRVAVFGFDLHESDLPLQPAFPILMHNITTWLLPPPVPDTAQLVPGIPLTIQAWPGADHVTITDPNRQVTTVAPPFPVATYDKTDTVGLYRVTQQVHGTTLNGAFTINLFDPTQSRLAPAKSLPVVQSSNIAPNNTMVPHQLREIWPWVAAFLLLVLCAEWWLFSRKYQSQAATAQRRRNDGQSLARGNFMQRSSRKNTFITTIQDRFQQQYTNAKKRTLKITKRMRGGLTRSNSKVLPPSGASSGGLTRNNSKVLPQSETSSGKLKKQVKGEKRVNI